jgi:sugar-phosphatase
VIRPAILSDLDGVLVDSTASVERAWRGWAEADGIPFGDLAPRIHGVPSRQTIAAFAPQLDAAQESRRLDAAQADDAGDVFALPGAHALLGSGYGGPVAIVTSCDQRLGRDPAGCVVVEDAPAGIAAGRAAGMGVVALLTTHEQADLDEADHVVADPSALPDLLAL